MRFPVKLAAAALAVAVSAGALAQQSGAMTDAELKKEGATADALYLSQNFIAALPLYEDLHRRQPEDNVWRERLAMSLLAQAGSQPEAQGMATRERAHKLLLEAKAAGDNSNLLQVLLEKLETPVSAAPAGPPSPGHEAFQRAEKAFSSGDLPGALKSYEEAVAADPKFYEAALFAGDTEYKQNHYAEADKWYARAAMINPDRETAYRYWGDCLMKQGDSTQAEGKFIDAIVAEPYTRTTRVGLKQWADLTKARLMAPAITLPARPATDAKGNTNITIDPTAKGPATSAALMYSMNAALWHGEKFKKTYPTETQYRHSLEEEVDGLRGALPVLKEQKIGRAHV